MKIDNTIVNQAFSDPRLQSLLQPEPDPWQGTWLQGYVYKNNKIKGKIGEQFAESVMVQMYHLVKKASSTGHDRIIDDILVEIKASAAHRDPKNKSLTIEDVFSFNHLSVRKNWQRAILMGFNVGTGGEIHACGVWFSKTDFEENLKGPDSYFTKQQSGKKGGNDDWMFMTKPDSWKKFISEPWVHPLGVW